MRKNDSGKNARNCGRWTMAREGQVYPSITLQAQNGDGPLSSRLSTVLRIHIWTMFQRNGVTSRRYCPDWHLNPYQPFLYPPSMLYNHVATPCISLIRNCGHSWNPLLLPGVMISATLWSRIPMLRLLKWIRKHPTHRHRKQILGMYANHPRPVALWNRQASKPS